MKNWTVLQDRYLREALPNRLGELAANLARISSFSHNAQNRDAVASLIDESKFFFFIIIFNTSIIFTNTEKN